MTGRIRALVALDTGVDRELVQAVLPHDGAIEIAGLVDGLDLAVDPAEHVLHHGRLARPRLPTQAPELVGPRCGEGPRTAPGSGERADPRRRVP